MLLVPPLLLGVSSAYPLYSLLPLKSSSDLPSYLFSVHKLPESFPVLHQQYTLYVFDSLHQARVEYMLVPIKKILIEA